MTTKKFSSFESYKISLILIVHTILRLMMLDNLAIIMKRPFFCIIIVIKVDVFSRVKKLYMIKLRGNQLHTFLQGNHSKGRKN